MLLGCEQTERRHQRQQQQQDWIPFDLIIHDDAPPDAWKMEGGSILERHNAFQWTLLLPLGVFIALRDLVLARQNVGSVSPQ